MAERTNAPVSKTGMGATSSWVRIPLSPPLARNTANERAARRFVAESCQSGRLGTTGNRVCPQGYRGFESHTLRQGPIYPCACGGTRNRRRPQETCPGLSPRVRGNLTSSCICTSAQGSIPACAGEPGQDSRSCPNRTVYPRVCGGTSFSEDITKTLEGLSPRVRGNLGLGQQVAGQGRSIPACAGEPQ